jgi:hypothetical protein
MTIAFINAQRFGMYLNLHDKERTPIAMAADGTGALSFTNNILYWNIIGTPTNIFTPSAGATKPFMVSSRDYAYFTDGVVGDLKKWNIDTGLSNWGIVAPTMAVTLGALTSGGVTLTTGRIYYVAFYNPTTGNYSSISPPSVSTGPMTAQEQPITGIPVSSDPGVTQKVLLATADGGDPTILYFLAQLPNATTTYTDNTPESTLLTANVYQSTDSSGIDHGLVDNDPPPNGSFPILHRGRLYMALGSQIVFSKSLAEITSSTGIVAGRYEENWPPSNAIEVAPGPEVIRGFLSDGTTLYIGTELHIHRLQGDGPSNFQQPEVVFNDTGLCCQDVWQVVYLEGTPVGTMWMTPDFRVLGSDFSTFENVGTPIQSTLNTINASYATNSFAMSVRTGPYNFYVLFIPTGTNTIPDTMCVFDMHLRKWYIWKCADVWSAGVYYVNLAGIPRWLMCDGNGITRVFEDTLFLDRQGDTLPVGIDSTIQTTWLSLGDSSVRKVLNEVEVETEDSNMKVSVDGATHFSEFQTPNNLVSNASLSQSLFGDYKVYLTGTASKDRFYRFTFDSVSDSTSSVTDTILGAINVEVFPFNKI